MFHNISEKYGDYVKVTMQDYRDLNPQGNFTEQSDGIYEDGVKVAEVAEQVILSVGESGTAPAARRNIRMSETEAREKIATYTEKSVNRELGKMLYRNSDGGWEIGETAYIVRPTDAWWHKYV